MNARWTLSEQDWLGHALADDDEAIERGGFVRARCGLVFAPAAAILTRPPEHSAMCSSCAEWVCRAAVGSPVFHRHTRHPPNKGMNR